MLRTIDDVISQYRPHVSDWEEIADQVNTWVVASAPATVSTAVSIKRYLAHYAQWRLGQGGDLRDAETFLDVDMVMFWLQETYGRSSSTFVNARAALFKVGRIVTSGVQYPPTPEPVRKRKVVPPLTGAEVDRMWAQVGVQPSVTARHVLTAILSLGLGAGLVPGELTHVRPQHVQRMRLDGENLVTFVEVHERFPRTVPVREVYADRLMECVERAERQGWQYLVGPVDHDRRDPVRGLRDRLVWHGSLPALAVTRLRTTWMAHLLRGPLVLDEFMEIAGLDSLRSVEEIITSMGVGNFPTVHAAVYAEVRGPQALTVPAPALTD